MLPTMPPITVRKSWLCSTSILASRQWNRTYCFICWKRSDMTDCPECGAAETLCKERFDEFLVLEFTDAGYGAVHHLTVATYMLQHSSKLTKEGWLHERELLKEFLVDHKPPAFICKQNKDLVDS